ncbi:N-acetylmuramoyl-L-alanine amidase [Propionibacterium freudenreichii]|uniref:N-acetylmuramoyl-L-alanine amidase n=1 Tax=Propionibacterium freudenreichii TaxID=1744 RepID=UPI00254C045D|nr:N-acetylmuramoyl-L-alanine amidase [Propionibacterium freudenreichii]MDK9655345.1 N-acetylmuramoyl-L-alanine amidase [Propionibacterium freudenreichii]
MSSDPVDGPPPHRARRAAPARRSRPIMVAVAIAVLAGAIAFLVPGGSTRPVPVAAPSSSASRPCTQAGRATVVFLDPGHGADLPATRATSGGSQGIYSGENTSQGNEPADVFAVALDAKAQLERAGYVVVLSRDGDPDPARQTLWQKGLRAETAMGGAPADIGVSIHTDLPDTVGAGQIYYDQLGGFRTNTSDGLTARFTDERSAALSRQYAQQFLTARQELGAGAIAMTPGHDFPAGRGLGSWGDIPIIMLTAQQVPWVYNEAPRTSANGLSPADRANYASAIVQGVERSLGPVVGTGTCS